MGYVMVSRALLQEICEKKGAACCEEEAFLRVLTNVNFKPAVVFCNGAGVQCARGESVITFMGWADIFGWTRARTRRFFDRCFAAGLIERVPGCCPSHIHVPGYDAWTGQPASIGKVMNGGGSFSAAAAPVAAKSKSSAAFEESLKEAAPPTCRWRTAAMSAPFGKNSPPASANLPTGKWKIIISA